LLILKYFAQKLSVEIDRVYVFQPVERYGHRGNCAAVKITKLAEQYRPQSEVVAPELLLQALAGQREVSRFGIRELERILDDMLAGQLLQARDLGAKEVLARAGPQQRRDLHSDLTERKVRIAGYTLQVARLTRLIGGRPGMDRQRSRIREMRLCISLCKIHLFR